jgi:hypothetical protein
MGIRTTVTLDEDVLDRLKQESRSRGLPFRQTLNELLRDAFNTKQPPQLGTRKFRIDPIHTGSVRDLNYDCTGALLEQLEGPYHR